MASPTQITVSQLSRLIGTPQAPILIDVCIDDDFNDDPRFIPGAIRHPFNDMASLALRLEPGLLASGGLVSGDQAARIVVICQKGKKISEGAAAVLRDHGIRAETLEGGNYAWRDAGQPLIPAVKLPHRNGSGSLGWGRTAWVTRQRPKIDRIACPWLIRRFVDRHAQFLFVAPGEVLHVAEKFGATPFDVEGVFWSHRGDKCTFDTMIEEFALETPPLRRLAAIVRGADTNTHSLAPEAAGLLAASLGLSRMYRDDLAQLDAGMGLYDAFYRWSRDAFEEGHDWPAAGNRS